MCRPDNGPMASTTLHVLQGAPPSPTAIITNPRFLQQLRGRVIRDLLLNLLAGENVPRDYDEPSFFGTYWHFLISVCLSKITPYNVTIATIAIIATIFRRQDSVPAEQSRGQQRGGSCPSCPSSPPTTSTYSTPQVRAFNCCHCKLSTLNTYFCQGRYFVVLLHISRAK